MPKINEALAGAKLMSARATFRLSFAMGKSAASAALLAVILSVQAQAGLLVGGTNLHGLMQGNTALNGSSVPVLGNIDGTIDWSVFAPGSAFQDFLSDNGLALAEGFSATNYVYVYQLMNVNSLSSGLLGPPSGIALNQVSVGLDLGDVVVGPAPGALPSAVGDVMPTGPPAPTHFAGATPSGVTSAVWSFFSGAIPNGGQSGLLFYASPAAPEFARVTFAAQGGATYQDNPTGLSGEPSGPGVPSPSAIPEPSSAALCVLAGICLFWRRK